MRRLSRLHPIHLALRLLLVAVCLWPFAGARQLANTFGFPLTPAAFAGQLPSAPVGEEEENERAEDAKGRIGQRTEYRPDPPQIAPRLPSVASTRTFASDRTSSACLSPADPFRNGLGTPYRC
jgi:hypothetical protein